MFHWPPTSSLDLVGTVPPPTHRSYARCVASADDRIGVLLVTGGHPFEREPFLQMFRDDAGLHVEHVEQPDAQHRLHPDRLQPDRVVATGHAPVDVIVFYDMPGLHFTRSEPPLELLEPSAQLQAGVEALLAAGVGMVFLHHAIASWPTWGRYGEIVGGRFHYAPGRLWGREWPDSGYLLDVTHTIEVIAPTHPVCTGLPPSFELRDELYLIPPIAAGVVPLLRSTHPMTDEHFFSTTSAISGRRNIREGWTHPAGPNLLGWCHTVGRSPVVYLQPGDGPACFANAHYRTLVGNAIRWCARTGPSS